MIKKKLEWALQIRKISRRKLVRKTQLAKDMKMMKYI